MGSNLELVNCTARKCFYVESADGVRRHRSWEESRQLCEDAGLQMATLDNVKEVQLYNHIIHGFTAWLGAKKVQLGTAIWLLNGTTHEQYNSSKWLCTIIQFCM